MRAVTWSAKIAYYGEFVFYPAFIAGLAIVSLWNAPPARGLIWLSAFAAGIVLWTLVEYLLHRYVLHHVPYIKEMHDAHHDEQEALIGTPVWISLGSFVVFLILPAWFAIGPNATAGLTAGMALGYVWFGGVHHILHHRRIKPGTYAYRLKRRHMLHHHFDDTGNFGVTNGFWDMVFGTDVKVRGPARSGD